MYIWVKQYFLKFVPNLYKNSFEISGDITYLSTRENSTVKQRENYVREQYSVLLKDKKTFAKVGKNYWFIL